MPDLAAWFEQVSALSLVAFVVVAFAGLLMGIAPSSLPLFSIVVGYVGGRPQTPDLRGTASTSWRHGFRISTGFVLGMATVDAAIGALFGLLGYNLIRVLASYLAITNFVLAGFLVVFGLALLRKIYIPLPTRRPSLQRASSFSAAYALGIPFGLSACPACTPMVLPILGAAAATEEPWLGAALLFTFGITRGLPLIAAGTATDSAKHIPKFGGWVIKIERASGLLLLLAAAFFLYQGAVYTGLVLPILVPL